jgi:hypothetical protein
MDKNQDNGGFQLPETFLLQLNEYTRGFILLVCNEKGELYAHESYDNPVIKLGLINFGEMHINAALQHMHNVALKEEERLEEMMGDESDDDEDQDSD